MIVYSCYRRCYDEIFQRRRKQHSRFLRKESHAVRRRQLQCWRTKEKKAEKNEKRSISQSQKNFYMSGDTASGGICSIARGKLICQPSYTIFVKSVSTVDVVIIIMVKSQKRATSIPRVIHVHVPFCTVPSSDKMKLKIINKLLPLTSSWLIEPTNNH